MLRAPCESNSTYRGFNFCHASVEWNKQWCWSSRAGAGSLLTCCVSSRLARGSWTLPRLWALLLQLPSSLLDVWAEEGVMHWFPSYLPALLLQLKALEVLCRISLCTKGFLKVSWVCHSHLHSQSFILYGVAKIQANMSMFVRKVLQMSGVNQTIISYVTCMLLCLT